jgi:UDP-3-O-[3-hydroxymyristoyl] glucosamine N-acyltransferase
LSQIALPCAIAVDQLARELGGELDPALRGAIIERVAMPAAASRATDLIALTASRWLEAARSSPGICLCSPELAERLPEGRRFRHAQPLWVLARVLERVTAARPSARPKRSEAAHIEPGAELAPDVVLGPGAVVLSGAKVGAGSVIEPNAVIYGGASLGERVSVGAGAVIGRAGFGFTPGPEGTMQRIPQLGGVVIEDDVEIGALCTIDAGTLGPTVLRRGCKLDAHVHVGHNVEIGRGTLVAAQAGFAGSSVIGPEVLVGGQAGVTDHAEVGRGARIAAKSGVIGDIPPGAVVAGFPAVPRMRWLRAMAATLRVRENKGRR